MAPDQFGLATLALVVGNFALMISDLGIGAALIHAEVPSRSKLDTAFWLNAISGLMVAGLVWVAAPALAIAVHEKAATGSIQLAALSCALSIYAVPLAMLERQLDLKTAGIIELTSVLVGTAVGLYLAVVGLGPRAVVAVPLSTAASNSVLYLLRTGYRPRGFINRVDAQSIISYTGGLIAFNVVNYFTRNTDTLLIARFSNASDVAAYGRAFSLMLLPVSQVQLVFGRVLFPALTTLRDDLPRLRTAHRRALVTSAIACTPIAVGMAATSRDLVLVVFGSAWLAMAPMLAILSLAGVQQVFQATAGTLYQTVGKTALMFKWNLLFTTLTIVAFIVGIRWGPLGVCWAVLIRGWLLLPVTLVVPLHLIGESLRGVLRLLGPVALCLVIEGVGVASTQYLLTFAQLAPVSRLVTEVATGACLYLGAMSIVQHRQLGELFAILGVKRSSRS